MKDPEKLKLPAATELLDSAISFASKQSVARVKRHRNKHPEATMRDLVRLLDKDLVVALTGQGIGVGTAAAAPGIGTSVALVMAGGEAAVTMNWTAVYVMALAEVYQIPVKEIERKRTLLLSVLMGGSAQKATAKVAGRSGKHWSTKIINKIPTQWLNAINSKLGQNFVTKYGTKQGIVVLGKVVPFGVGAAIGGTMNFVMAQGIVQSAHRVFEIEGGTGSETSADFVDEDVLNEGAST